MGRKKKLKKIKTPPQILLQSEDKTLIKSILQESEDTDPTELVNRVPDSRLAQAIIEHLGLEKNPSIPLLLAIKEHFKDKQVQKSIKRTLYKLAQHGILSVDALKPETVISPITRPSLEKKPEAFLGPILNLFGSRALLLTHHRGIKGQHMALGIISDEDGFHDFFYGPLSKKRSKTMKEHLSEKTGPLVETTMSHAATVLETAYHRHMEIHAKAPAFYPDLRPWLLENAPVLQHPAVYDLLPEGQETSRLLTNSQLEELFTHHLMETWLLEFKRIQAFLEEILEINNSTIVLTAKQKTDQKNAIIEKCINSVFDDAERMLLKQRLEEMALVFFKLEGRHMAQLCLDAARTLDPEKELLHQNSVIEFLVNRSVDCYMAPIKRETHDKKEKTENPTPSIILP